MKAQVALTEALSRKPIQKKHTQSQVYKQNIRKANMIQKSADNLAFVSESPYASTPSELHNQKKALLGETEAPDGK